LLILLVLCVATKGFVKGIFWGMLIGLFLDLVSHVSYFYLFVYAIFGGLISMIPPDFFKNYRTLIVTNVVVGTFLLSLLKIIFTRIIFQKIVLISMFGLFSAVFFNAVLAYILAKPLGRIFGIYVKD